MNTKKVTYKQYLAARALIEKCQKESSCAMRDGNQTALDAAIKKSVRALAVIVDYKNQQNRV
jgi:hypothetical protein